MERPLNARVVFWEWQERLRRFEAGALSTDAFCRQDRGRLGLPPALCGGPLDERLDFLASTTTMRAAVRPEIRFGLAQNNFTKPRQSEPDPGFD